MKNHYSDPTANTAIGNVERELRKAAKKPQRPPVNTVKAFPYRYVRFDKDGQIISSTIITPPGKTPGAFFAIL